MTHQEQSLADDRMRAEIARIARERYWIPFTVFGGVIVAASSIIPRLFS